MKILKCFCLILSVVICVFSFAFGNKKIDQNLENGSVSDNRYIVKVWHVTTFEGGTGSRRNFLNAIAKEFENKYKNALFLVTEVTEDQFSLALKNGDLPDIISYSSGIDVAGLKTADFIKNYASCKIGEKVYSTPWARGAYFIISQKEIDIDDVSLSNAVISKTNYTLPEMALSLLNIDFSNAKIKMPTNAYYDFIMKKSEILVGTQRDIHRLNAMSFPYFAKHIDCFSDIYQYVGILSESEIKKDIAQDFINYLISDGVQKRLNGIGLFSPYLTGLYSDGTLSTAEKLLPKTTLSAFVGKNFYVEFSQKLKTGNGLTQEEKLKIKNMLIYLDNFIKV